MRCRFDKIAYSICLTIFSTVSLHSFADGETYKVVRHAYINSLDGSVEAACRPGDQPVKSLCSQRTDAISVPAGERMPFPAFKDSETALLDAPLKVQTTAEGANCRPEKLRTDQRIRLILTVHCQPSHS